MSNTKQTIIPDCFLMSKDSEWPVMLLKDRWWLLSGWHPIISQIGEDCFLMVDGWWISGGQHLSSQQTASWRVKYLGLQHHFWTLIGVHTAHPQVYPPYVQLLHHCCYVRYVTAGHLLLGCEKTLSLRLLQIMHFYLPDVDDKELGEAADGDG